MHYYLAGIIGMVGLVAGANADPPPPLADANKLLQCQIRMQNYADAFRKAPNDPATRQARKEADQASESVFSQRLDWLVKVQVVDRKSIEFRNVASFPFTDDLDGERAHDAHMRANQFTYYYLRPNAIRLDKLSARDKEFVRTLKTGQLIHLQGRIIRTATWPETIKFSHDTRTYISFEFDLENPTVFAAR